MQQSVSADPNKSLEIISHICTKNNYSSEKTSFPLPIRSFSGTLHSMTPRVPAFIQLPFWLWWKSLTDLGSYLPALGLRRARLLWSVTVIYVLLGSANTAWFATQVLPQWVETSQTAWSELAREWPDDVILTYSPESGQLTQTSRDPDTSPNEPWHVTWPESLDQPSYAPANLASVQLSQPGAAADDTALLTLTPSAVITTGSSAQQIPWSELLPTSVNEPEVYTADWARSDDRRQDIAKFWEILQPLFVSMYWVASTFGVLLMRWLALFFYAWIGQGLAGLLGLRFTYRTAYKLGLICLIAPETILSVWRWLYQSPPPISLWWIWLAVWGVVVWYFRQQGQNNHQS